MELETNFLGDFIDGEFHKGLSSHSWTLRSPADRDDLVLEVCSSLSHVDQACMSARRAFLKWRAFSLEERKEKILSLKGLFDRSLDKMALCISRETGKPFWEAKQEALALSSKISATLESLKLVSGEEMEDLFPGVRGRVSYQPRGVMAVIGPFNFPAHLPNGHMIPALLMGNTIVFKPSEKTPLTGQFLTQIFSEASFPPGVINMVQGTSSTGQALVNHKEVDGVLFTGSYGVGRKIKEQTLNDHWKLLALEMGGKNTSVVWKGVSLKKALYENIVGAFLTSGQRCSSTSQLVLHKDIYDEFLSFFSQSVKTLKVGHWKEDSFMGPLIDESALKRHLWFQKQAIKEGGELVMEGKALHLKHKGYYVSPSVVRVKGRSPSSVYQNSEIFTPSLAVYSVSEFEEAVEIIHQSGYGLAVSFFSKEDTLYKRALREVKAGLIHWNRSTCGASARLPFGGRGKSGNDRAAGFFSLQYCSVPVGSLEDLSEWDAKNVPLPPGLKIQFA